MPYNKGEVMPTRTPVNAIIFSNGNTAFFDSSGQQIPELQEAWMRLLLNFLDSKGVDPTKVTFLTTVNGQECQMFPFKEGRREDPTFWCWEFKCLTTQ